MGTKRVIYNKSDAVRACLENICDEKLRDAAHKTGARIARISGPRLFHTGNGLSPAGGIARDARGQTFVSDEFNHRIIVYGPDLAVLHTIGAKGTDAGQFHYPRGLALDGEGNLYVADAWNHRVAVVGPDFAVKTVIGKLGGKQGELDEPCGVAVADGRLYVLEKSNHRVQVFTLEGVSLGIIGKRGTADEQEQFYVLYGAPETFQPPVFEFPSAIAADKEGNIYIADTNNHRVVKIRPDLGYDSMFNPSGLRYPVGVACDSEGNVHISQFSREGAQAVSPEGAMLYRYLPSGIEVPVTICISGDNALVAGGMKAGVSAMTIEAEHGAGAALEDEFGFHLRHGLCAARAGDWEAAAEHLAAVPAARGKDLKAFTALLPESDLLFAAPATAPDLAGLIPLLEGFSDALWGELETLLNAKIAAADENANATLQLEKTLLLGGENVDPLMVDRFRAVKKLHTISATIKKTACALKKTEELLRRFARAGAGTQGRLARLALTLARITEWKRKKEEWFNAAAKEAPSLSFNSLPDERAAFALNESRLELLGFEFRLLWKLAAEQNHELAGLAGALPEGNAALGGYAFAAADFALFSPEDFQTGQAYLLSLDALFTALGPERMAAMAAGETSADAWERLAREDNIPHGTQSAVYRLLPALWATPMAAPSRPNTGSWEKIVAFYHAEFVKFLAEHSPLRTEMVRTAQMQPLAEKTDPKQSALLLRKLGLLRFHNLFQERYIGAMMVEYVVRFALFRLHNAPFTPEQRQATADALEKLFAESAAARFAANPEMAQLAAKAATTRDIAEKQKLRIQQTLALLTEEYHGLLGFHLSLAETAAHATGAAKPPRTRLAETGAAGRLWFASGAASGPEGDLYITAHYGIFVFDPQGRFVRRISGYGAGPGRMNSPLDISFLRDGSLVTTQFNSRTLEFFTAAGRHTGGIRLHGDEGRNPCRVQEDAEGRLFVSFLDGGDLSVYGRNGNKTGSVVKKGGPLEYIERIHGFAIMDGALITGGNGRLTATTLDGHTAKAALDVPCGTLSSLCAGTGAVYAVDNKNNLVIAADPALSAATRIAPLKTLAPAAVAASNGLLAVADNFAHRALLIEL